MFTSATYGANATQMCARASNAAEYLIARHLLRSGAGGCCPAHDCGTRQARTHARTRPRTPQTLAALKKLESK